MNRSLQITPEAELELEEAQWWYERRRSGLGAAFMHVFDRLINALRDLPESMQLVALKTRRAYLRPFSYFVLYTASSHELAVTAVFHEHRDPQIWSDRVREPTQLWQTMLEAGLRPPTVSLRGGAVIMTFELAGETPGKTPGITPGKTPEAILRVVGEPVARR